MWCCCVRLMWWKCVCEGLSVWLQCTGPPVQQPSYQKGTSGGGGGRHTGMKSGCYPEIQEFSASHKCFMGVNSAREITKMVCTQLSVNVARLLKYQPPLPMLLHYLCGCWSTGHPLEFFHHLFKRGMRYTSLALYFYERLKESTQVQDHFRK
jgi:hypothetical protein